MVTLRFLATGAFQSVIGNGFGISQPTASRTIARVSAAIVHQTAKWVQLPTQQQADAQKVKFFHMAGFPGVIRCVDGTHVRIQAPRVKDNEYVNRKNFHSVNIQVRMLSKLCQSHNFTICLHLCDYFQCLNFVYMNFVYMKNKYAYLVMQFA